MSDFWKTSISKVSPNEILIRGYPVEELARHRSFGDVVYLLLSGQLPAGNEGLLVEAILVACVDHGLASPSADAVRFVASSGVPLQTAVAAGVGAIGMSTAARSNPAPGSCAMPSRRANRRSSCSMIYAFRSAAFPASAILFTPPTPARPSCLTWPNVGR